MLKTNHLLEGIREDNLSYLQAFVGDGGNIDEKLAFEDLTPDEDDILKCNPPLISYAAFYRAESCITYLLQNAVKLDQKDVFDVPFKKFLI